MFPVSKKYYERYRTEGDPASTLMGYASLQYACTLPDGSIHADQEKIENIGGTFVTMPDGLWMLRDIVIENDDHMNEMALLA